MMVEQVGFEVVEALAEAEGMVIRQNEQKSLIAKGRINGATVVLAKPQTFMNRSGDSVRALNPKTLNPKP